MNDTPVLYHDLTGPARAPLLVLGPSLGTSSVLWERALPGLNRHWRVLRFDLPGHGGSPAGLLPDLSPGSTTVADLAQLVLDLVDHHDDGTFHYAGISLGGAIGAHLALNHPERVASLGLLCTSARFGPPAQWRDRAALVRREGTKPLLSTAPARWFAEPRTAETFLGRALLQSLAQTDPAGYAACCDALAAYDLRRDLHRITAPTLVVGGTHDIATPLEHAQQLVDGIAGATMLAVDSGHLAVERATAVTAALSTHLQRCGPDRPHGYFAPAPCCRV
ncbi:alpha/beta fold hydrolase [Streptomyces sp. NPDC056296]|uniref:alpha/beta fold hydrolase n=1 Tax=Streptomyces sp. NPDC056296 TaxID=3345775 RepID=UPI0035DC6BB1